MNFTIDAKALQGALKLAGKLANQKTTIPVLSGVMLEATDNGTVVITATDLETACRISVDATVEVAGVVVLNCKALQSALPKKGMVTIDGHTVHNGAFHVTVPSFPVESYPENLREWLESQTSDTVCLKLKQKRMVNKETMEPIAVEHDHEKHALALYGDAGVESVLMPMR